MYRDSVVLNLLQLLLPLLLVLLLLLEQDVHAEADERDDEQHADDDASDRAGRENDFKENVLFFKNGRFPGLFFLIFVFSILLIVNIFNKIFADDWIRTADLCSCKQILYQLSHNH